MTWLFYLLSLLLIVWALSVLALVIYIYGAAFQRAKRTRLRAEIQETIQDFVGQVGGIDLVRGYELAEALRRFVSSDRVCLRDALIDQALNTQGDFLTALRETYEKLGFTTEDVKKIQQGNWHQKAEAIIRLGQMRCTTTIEVVTGALRESDKEIKMAAVCALAEMGDARSVSAIIYALADADGWQILQVADKLLNMQTDITRPLLELLQMSGAIKDKREAAAKIVLELIADFGQRGSECLAPRPARNAASQFLNSESIDMRARAIRAVAAVGIETNEELELIIDKLQDKDWQIRAVAAKALGQLQQSQAIPALSSVLIDEAWWVRHNAAHALILLGQMGINELTTQSTNPDRFAREIAKQVLEEFQIDAAIKTGN